MAAADGDLVLTSVTKRFGGLTAVSEASITVRQRAIHGIIGPNGAGKSTLVNLIAGALKPTSGTITFAGQDIGKSPPYRRARTGITRTFQGIQLFDEFTVLENVVSGYHSRRGTGVPDALLGLPRGRRERREALTRAAEVLDFVGIEHLADTLAADLPYGHRRLVEVARALAPRPELILLDEPAAGMNMGERRTLVTLIGKIRAEGCTVAVIEHHMDVIMTICETITVLSQGKTICEGTPAEVQKDPDVLAAYLGPGVGAEKPA